MEMVTRWSEQARSERGELELAGLWAVMGLYALGALLFVVQVWA